jgi:hypothetical protein
MAVNAIEIAATDTFMASPSVDDPHSLIDRIIELNRTHDSLQLFREKALAGKATWQLNAQGLLTHQGKLMVPEVDFLRTHLI